MKRRSRMNSRGSALVLSIGLAVISMVVVFGALYYSRMLSSQQEQTSSIGAAALVAGKDLSRVIIDDPNFGYVGLCDQQPSGSGVAAMDGYGLPVRSVNTILGTIRLQAIIADRLNNTAMKMAAAADFANAMTAVDNLNNVLQSSILEKPPSLVDSAGKPITIYADVLEAYKSNAIRSNGRSEVVANSLRLQLGFSKSALTSTPVPTPRSMDATLPSSAYLNGMYRPNQLVPYGSQSFVFSGLASYTNLINNSDFQLSFPNLPYSVPSAIKVEVDQLFNGTEKSAGYAVHAIACAQTGGAGFLCPAPGALIVTLPDGCPDEITNFKTMTENVAYTQNVAYYQKYVGDYPAGNSTIGTSTALPYLNTMADSVSIGLFMWLRRGGPCTNIQDFLNTMNNSIAPKDSLKTPMFISFTFEPTSRLIQKKVSFFSNKYSTGSDSQICLLGQNCLTCASTARAYDIIVTINCFQPGDRAGGSHGGEPIIDPRLTQSPPFVAGGTAPAVTLYPAPWKYISSPCWCGPSGGWMFNAIRMFLPPSGTRFNYQKFGGDFTPPNFYIQPTASKIGDLRPSYSSNGNAVEITLHQWSNSIGTTQVKP